MSSRVQNIIVGAFVLASIFILLFGVYYLKETAPGRKTDIYYAQFDQVSTLQEGDPVKVNGVKMGRVKSIALQGRGVKVAFELRRGIRLTQNSEVRIQNIGLMGERQIGIRLGDSGAVVPPGGTLNGRLDAGIAEAMGAAGEVFVEAETLVRELRAVLDSTVGRPEFAQQVNSLLTNTEDLSRRLSALEKNVDPKIRAGAQTFQSLSREMDGFVRTQEPKVDSILNHGQAASARAESLAVRGERVAAGLEAIVNQANSQNSTLGALLHDSTLQHDLHTTLRSADSLFRSVNKKGLNVNLDLF